MTKKQDILIFLGAIIVLAAILAGVVFLTSFASSEEEKVIPTETSVVDDVIGGETNKGTSGGSGSGVIYPNFDTDEDNRHLGYITEGNITTFFIAVESPLVFEDGASTWRIEINYADIKKLSSYDYKPLYSLDGGQTWNYLDSTIIEGVPSTENYTLNWGGMRKDVEILLAYTQIENCVNPYAVLSDLRNAIFNDRIVLSTVTGESYVSYSNFKYVKNIILPNGAPV